MIEVSHDWEGLAKAMESYSEDWKGFDPEKLVNDPDNILLSDGKDNFSLFEGMGDGMYEGHYLFGSARGTSAVEVSKEMLAKIFSVPGVKGILGKTPSYHKGALWLNRKLGFIPCGVQERAGKVYHLFLLMKEGHTL